MLRFLKNRICNQTQQNKEESVSHTAQTQMCQLRKRIGLQAGLAALTIVLTVVLIFAMAAAWYTNVVQTSGLIFQVEQWGVDVGAAIYSEAIQAAPGDEGIVSFVVNNTGTEIVNVAIGVTKNSMESVMQRRLYFYVDTQQVVNQERMDRVYLNSETNYDYRLFGGGNISLNEDYHNDVPLKWCWVYDVLGYYVRADRAGNSITVNEYLRPIEYDYDAATFDADGNVATVDGTTGALDFLVELSKKDGYSGTLDADSQSVNGYYPIEVDEKGSGVYVYLLNDQQIKEEMDTDTALGAAAGTNNAKAYTANFTIYAENYTTEAVSIRTADSLKSALSIGNNPVIRLEEDITLTEPITVPAASNMILDLNGHTLTTNTEDAAITMSAGSALAISGGALSGTSGSGNAFSVTGAEVTLNDVKLSGYEMGVWITDNSAGNADSVVRLTNCEMSTNDCAVLVYGNGAASEQTTKVIVENSKLVSNDIVICGNGTATGDGRWGTDIQIINSEIFSKTDVYAAGIYHPQKHGTLNIVNSEITGFVGIAVKGGTVSISGSSVTGAGPQEMIAEPEYRKSGYSDTGDGVYIEDGYQYDISVTIDSTSTLSSYYAKGLRTYAENSIYIHLINEAEQKDGTATQN